MFAWGALVALDANPADIAYTKASKETHPDADAVCHVVIDNTENPDHTIEIDLQKEHKTGAIGPDSTGLYIRVQPSSFMILENVSGELLKSIRGRAYPAPDVNILFLVWENPTPSRAQISRLIRSIGELKEAIQLLGKSEPSETPTQEGPCT